MSDNHIGGTLDDFLADEGILAEVEAKARRKAERLRERAAQDERDRIRVEWMARNGLQECRGRGLRMVARVGSDLRKVRGGHWQQPESIGRNTKWFDHCWTFYHPQGRYYVFTSQPYSDPTDELLAAIRQFCEPHGIAVEASWEGWHNPTRCPLIVFRPADKSAIAGNGG